MQTINIKDIDKIELILSNREIINIAKENIIDCSVKFIENEKDGVKNLTDGKLILDNNIKNQITYNENGKKNDKKVKDRLNGASDIVYIKFTFKDGKISKLDVPYEEKEDKTTGGIFGYNKCSEARYQSTSLDILMGKSSSIRNVSF